MGLQEIMKKQLWQKKRPERQVLHKLIVDTLGIKELECGKAILVGDVLGSALGKHQLVDIGFDIHGSLVQSLAIAVKLILLGGETSGAQNPEPLLGSVHETVWCHPQWIPRETKAERIPSSSDFAGNLLENFDVSNSFRFILFPRPLLITPWFYENLAALNGNSKKPKIAQSWIPGKHLRSCISTIYGALIFYFTKNISLFALVWILKYCRNKNWNKKSDCFNHRSFCITVQLFSPFE